MKKRILASLLAVYMVVGMLPTMAAENGAEPAVAQAGEITYKEGQ